MKKFDIIIIASVIALAAGLYASGIFSPKAEGAEAVIYVDKEEYARLPLDENTSITVNTDGAVTKSLLRTDMQTVLKRLQGRLVCETEKNQQEE